MSAENLKLPHQLGRFLILGLASALIDIGLLAALVEWARFHYLAATAVSFLCANSFNYSISRHWIFVTGKYGRTYEYTGFIAASAIGLSIHQIVMLIMVDQGHYDYRISKIICIGIVASWNYLTRKYFVFAG